MKTYPLNPSCNINFRYIPFTIKMSSSEDEEAEYSRARTLTKLIMESTRQFTDTIRMCEEDYPSKDPALNSGINLIMLKCAFTLNIVLGNVLSVFLKRLLVRIINFAMGPIGGTEVVKEVGLFSFHYNVFVHESGLFERERTGILELNSHLEALLNELKGEWNTA